MSIQCSQCGRVDRIGKASVIVDQETYTSSVMRNGVANGQYVTYRQNVTSQSDLARNLTADEPIKELGCVGTLVVGSLLTIPTLGILMSCEGWPIWLRQKVNGYN